MDLLGKIEAGLEAGGRLEPGPGIRCPAERPIQQRDERRAEPAGEAGTREPQEPSHSRDPQALEEPELAPGKPEDLKGQGV